MRAQAAPPPFLRLLLWRVGLTFALSWLLLSLVVGALLHRQIHSQTDQLLLQLVRTEADGVLSELDAGVHVHDTTVQIPTLQRNTTDKYALAYTHEGQVLASTSNLTLQTLPAAWSEGLRHSADHRIFDDTLEGVALRVAAYATRDAQGHLLLFAVAVPHRTIDEAIRKSGPPIALLAAVLLGIGLGSAALLARQLTRDLLSLSHTCQRLGEPSTASLAAWCRELEALPPATTEETALLQEALQRLAARLQQMISLQSRFMAEASHELRTPLAALQGELELALRRPREAAEYREFVENAYDNTRHLVALAERLLQAVRSRVEELSLEPCSAAVILQQALSRSQAALAAAGIQVHLDAADPVLLADPMAVGRVLDNLLGNAARHSQARQLHITPVPDGILLRDDGVGISAEMQGRLFMPFSGEGAGGHGLGLYISQRLMVRQGGTLELLAGPGTAWRLTFAHRSRPV